MKNFNKIIPLHAPYLKDNSEKYLKECVKSTWISTAGKFVDKFESKIIEFTKSKYAISCINGTSALHISLIVSGVKPDDEIIVPTLSFIAPINAVKYCGASPIFMDSDDDYCIDINKTIEFINNKTSFKNNHTYNKKTKKRISTIIIVHVYGRSVMLDRLANICNKKNINLIEDAAESLGNFFTKGKYKNKHTGTIGKFGCISFNGNKIVTCGGGGIILTNDKKLADRAKYLTTTAKDDPIYFKHNDIGYNYRLTNLNAAVGLAQMENIKYILKKKKYIFKKYYDAFVSSKKLNFKKIPSHATSNYWLNLIEFNYKNFNLEKRIKEIISKQIDVRPVWQLNHLQKKFLNYETYKISNATKLVKKTICLPSSVDISNKQIQKVISSLNE